MKKILFSLVTICVLACHTKAPENGLFKLFEEDPNAKPFFSDKKGVIAKNGMVACAHPVASQVGVGILQAGGNAIDAAIATHFALAVVFPFAGNIGGGGFAVIRLKNGETAALDFRETAPSRAHRDMYLDKDGNVVQGLSTRGYLASGTPGSVDGMVELHKKYGSLAWEKLLEPAIKLAREGVELTEREAMGLNNNVSGFKDVNGKDCMYFSNPKGTKWLAKEILIQEDLAKVLEIIKANKRAGFYEGAVADMLVKDMKANGGIIELTDLKAYKSVWRKPLEGKYRNHKIITMPPASSGGVALMQLFGMVDQYPLSQWGWNTDKTTQVMVEAERRVYADRAKWLGDMDFVKVPSETLMSKDYLESRWANVDLTKATLSKDIEGGSIKGESDETTHYSIVDKSGNAVSITTTLNGAYGSKVIIKGGGFLMNNEMDDFSIKAGVPNMFGLIGNKKNEITAGKRMLSSMTPTIVEKNNKLYMVVGTPGGSTIITSVFQTILNVIDHHMTMQQAVNALKFHHQWLPDKVVFEQNAISEKNVGLLKSKGYIMESQKGTLGRMDCIMLKSDGNLEGASDPRADNTSIGY